MKKISIFRNTSGPILQEIKTEQEKVVDKIHHKTDQLNESDAHTLAILNNIT